jgi:hypothetical protein
MSMAGFRSATCVQCGRGFSDDCGDSFCSSSCERHYEQYHMECSRCGDEVGEDNLNESSICESCEIELEESED